MYGIYSDSHNNAYFLGSAEEVLEVYEHKYEGTRFQKRVVIKDPDLKIITKEILINNVKSIAPEYSTGPVSDAGESISPAGLRQLYEAPWTDSESSSTSDN